MSDFELTSFQILTPGLYSGDNIDIIINYRIECHAFLRYLGWRVAIGGVLNGQTAEVRKAHSGTYGGADNLVLHFTGKMPSGQNLEGFMAFACMTITFPFSYFTTKQPLAILNLDDVIPPPPPNGEPPAICTEGQERCIDYDRYVCQGGQWKVKEYNSPNCGYIPPPFCAEGTRRCVGTTLQKCINNQWTTEKSNATECGYVPPTPPNRKPPFPSEESWFERNKTTIIIVSTIVLIIAIAVLVSKTKLRSPVAAPLKFQRPMIKR